jgi:hypothetical protein
MRARQVSLAVGDDGVVITNFFRTRRLAWADIRSFVTSSVQGYRSHRDWALGIFVSNGETYACQATMAGVSGFLPRSVRSPDARLENELFQALRPLAAAQKVDVFVPSVTPQ